MPRARRARDRARDEAGPTVDTGLLEKRGHVRFDRARRDADCFGDFFDRYWAIESFVVRGEDLAE